MKSCFLLLPICFLVGSFLFWECSSFQVPHPVIPKRQIHDAFTSSLSQLPSAQRVRGCIALARCSTSFSGKNTRLQMSSNDDSGGGIQSVLFSLLGAGIIILFVATSFLPLMGGGASRDLSIADSVVTRQDAPGKLQNYEAFGDRLSRSSIQEKLNTVPVFYLFDKDNVMRTDIFMSYLDAQEVANAQSLTVKATTLDQVTYPLVLKRGRMRMAPPPVAIQKAEEDVMTDDQGRTKVAKTYRLVPSKAAVKGAAEFNMVLEESDIPLFVADRLAFAGPRGPQLPLFLEKADCITSYQRLRGSSTRLPETPNIRTTTLMDTVTSMEKGSRPGASRLAFYSTAQDLVKATDLMQQGP